MELKPCPFCGKQLIKDEHEIKFGIRTGQMLVTWSHNNRGDCILSGLEVDPQDVELWNTRNTGAALLPGGV